MSFWTVAPLVAKGVGALLGLFSKNRKQKYTSPYDPELQKFYLSQLRNMQTLGQDRTGLNAVKTGLGIMGNAFQPGTYAPPTPGPNPYAAPDFQAKRRLQG